MKIEIESLVIGEVEKIKDYVGFSYRVVDAFHLTIVIDGQKRMVVVPENFLTDGATCAPDLGYAWVFHDWLYSTHCYAGKEECTRQEADVLFDAVSKKTGWKVYGKLARFVLWCNPFRIVTKAWTYSGRRGPVYATDEVEKLN